jgi:hypothetical protein
MIETNYWEGKHSSKTEAAQVEFFVDLSLLQQWLEEEYMGNYPEHEVEIYILWYRPPGKTLTKPASSNCSNTALTVSTVNATRLHKESISHGS